MASQQQLLERMDRTLDRIDARLEQGDRRWEESERRWEENDRRWEERDAELKAFIREMTGRHVQVTQEMIGAIQQLGAEVADQRSQLRANTEATWRLLDERFGPQRPQG